jgi:hypothetical protein
MYNQNYLPINPSFYKLQKQGRFLMAGLNDWNPAVWPIAAAVSRTCLCGGGALFRRKRKRKGNQGNRRANFWLSDCNRLRSPVRNFLLEIKKMSTKSAQCPDLKSLDWS